jgi:hypothetical protein
VRFRAFVSAALDAYYDWDLQTNRLEMSGHIDGLLALEAGPLPTVRLPEGGDGEHGDHGEHESDGDAAEVHARLVRRRAAGGREEMRPRPPGIDRDRRRSLFLTGIIGNTVEAGADPA